MAEVTSDDGQVYFSHGQVSDCLPVEVAGLPTGVGREVPLSHHN